MLEVAKTSSWKEKLLSDMLVSLMWADCTPPFSGCCHVLDDGGLSDISMRFRLLTPNVQLHTLALETERVSLGSEVLQKKHVKHIVCCKKNLQS